jgi:hypothetical protein
MRISELAVRALRADLRFLVEKRVCCSIALESESGAFSCVISDRVVDVTTSAMQKASSERLSNIVVDDHVYHSLRSMTRSRPRGRKRIDGRAPVGATLSPMRSLLRG